MLKRSLKGGIFAERLPEFAAPFARRAARLAGIVRLFGHGFGGARRNA